MTKDWELIAKGLAPEIPSSDMEKIRVTLQSLEDQLESLLKSLPHEIEPAFVFQGSEEEHS